MITKEQLFIGYGFEIKLADDFKRNLLLREFTSEQEKAYRQYKARGLEISMITNDSGATYKTYLYAQRVNPRDFEGLDLFLEDYATNISELNLIRY